MAGWLLRRARRARAPYTPSLGGGPLTVGLLMAAMPAGMMAGGLVLAQMPGPAQRTQLIGWLAMLSRAPLICSLLGPPVWVLVPLWALAGAAGTYQLATAAAFTRTLGGAARARAFGVAQSGLLAAQGLGIVVAGMAASTLGPQRVVGIAGLLGVSAAAILAARWAGHAEHADHNAHAGHAGRA